jgi:hypothetical protein
VVERAATKEQVMKKRLYGFGVVAAVVGALALGGRAMAEGKQVPFKGQSSGLSIDVSFDPVAGIAHGRVEGEGRATHLGRFTVTGDVAVEVATGIAQGTWTLTTANGDQIFLDMVGENGSDDHHGLGEFTITGGTGRFEGASGSYEQIITFAAPLGSAAVIDYTDVFEGTISTVGSNER